MLLTEGEAKKKRCCGPEGTGDMGYPLEVDTPPIPRYCIASQCMAWRWVGVSKEKLPPYQKEVRPGQYVVAHNDTKETPTGFCGLAGRVK